MDVGSRQQKRVMKPHVEEQTIALGVNQLARRGVLRAGACGTLSWGPPGEPSAMIEFRSTGSEFVISYNITNGADVRSRIEAIVVAPVAAGLGGTRTYFHCPGAECNRRVEKLYFASDRFRCRRCHGLAYASQYEDSERRAIRAANKARARLGYPAWQPFERTPIWRPRGMWRRKFHKLQDFVELMDGIAGYENDFRFRAKLEKLNRMTGGRKR